MNLEKLQKDVKTSYDTKLKTVDQRVENILKHINTEFNIESDRLTLSEIQKISTIILDIELKELHGDVQTLLAQKEQIERKLDKKTHELQESKYNIFNAIESQFNPENEEILSKLHQVKLQTVDIYDLLSEIVESAIITALEKDSEIDYSILEVIKHITYEAIEEGSLNTTRIRQILSTILLASVEIAEASPVQAKEILTPTLKGMRAGLIHSISRFKQSLEYIPTEAKHILIEDYDTIIYDLNRIDSLFAQIVQTQANESSNSVKDTLTSISKDMRYDLDELLRISKETADIMKDTFSDLAIKAVEQADKALRSQKAIEAKRMGKQAFGIAKTAIDSAIKTAKDAIDNKK